MIFFARRADKRLPEQGPERRWSLPRRFMAFKSIWKPVLGMLNDVGHAQPRVWHALMEQAFRDRALTVGWLRVANSVPLGEQHWKRSRGIDPFADFTI